MTLPHVREYTGPRTLVLDVSHWQGEIDWSAVAASPVMHRERELGQAAGVIVRTGDGKTPDDRAHRNITGALDAGLHVEVYHYLRGAHSAAIQWDVVRRHVPEGARIWWDLEGGPDPDGDGPRRARGAWQHRTSRGDRPIGHGREVSTAEVLEQILELGDLASAAGHPWGLYTGRAWLDHVDAPPPWTWGVPLWVAVGARGRVPGPWGVGDVVLHQFTAKARVRGIAGPVDANWYHGTAEELRGAAAPPRFDYAGEVAELAEGAPPEERAILLDAARRLGELRRCV